MRERSEPLVLMAGAERESYLDWLLNLARGRKGALAERFRQAVRELREQGSMS